MCRSGTLDFYSHILYIPHFTPFLPLPCTLFIIFYILMSIIFYPFSYKTNKEKQYIGLKKGI